jgi:hypothetical protein
VPEETGLTVASLGSLLYTTRVHVVGEGLVSTAFCFLVTDWSGEIRVGDPGRDGVRAEFLSPAEAIDRLQRRAPPRAMREPAVAYLSGQAQPGAAWSYRALPNGVQLLLEKTPPPPT